MHKGSSILLLRDQLTPQFKTLSKDEQLDIENHSKSLKHQRESFTQELLANLKKVDSNTEELKKAISLDIQNIGLHYFKDVIKEINTCLDRNDNILNLKQKEINEEEKILSNELKQVEQRIFDLSIGKTNLTKKTALHYKPLETYHVNLPESICAFDDFLLKSGGHSGGWKAEDHQMFLHLKNKYKTEQVAEMLHSKLPDISIDQILEHDKWYEQYTRLLQDKKHTVEKWKSSRKSGRSQSVGNIEEIMRTESLDSNRSTGRQNEWKKTDAEVKKQIAEWKLAKALKLKEEQAQKRQQEEKKRAMEKEKKEMKLMEKQKVKQYINSKLEAQLQEKEEYRNMREEEKKNKSKKANIMIQVYRKQDEKRLREKLDRKQQFVLKELENIERLRRVKSEVNVGRDPRRVQKPTCGWKNKISGEAEESGESTRDVTFITHVPHLKVPDWRQDVKFEDQIIL